MVAPVSSQPMNTQYQMLEEPVKKEELLQDAGEENQVPPNSGELKGGSHGDFSYSQKKYGSKCCVIL